MLSNRFNSHPPGVLRTVCACTADRCEMQGRRAFSDASQAVGRLTIPTAQVFRFFDSLFRVWKTINPLRWHWGSEAKTEIGNRYSKKRRNATVKPDPYPWPVFSITGQFLSFPAGNLDTDGPPHVCVKFFVYKTTTAVSDGRIWHLSNGFVSMAILLAARCYRPAPHLGRRHGRHAYVAQSVSAQVSRERGAGFEAGDFLNVIGRIHLRQRRMRGVQLHLLGCCHRSNTPQAVVNANVKLHLPGCWILQSQADVCSVV